MVSFMLLPSVVAALRFAAWQHASTLIRGLAFRLSVR
jgi:hypothetical protein